jgi:hypothetical protein
VGGVGGEFGGVGRGERRWRGRGRGRGGEDGSRTFRLRSAGLAIQGCRRILDPEEAIPSGFTVGVVGGGWRSIGIDAARLSAAYTRWGLADAEWGRECCRAGVLAEATLMGFEAE